MIRRIIKKIYNKACDIEKLKGTKLKDFLNQKKIQSDVSYSFEKIKGYKSKECVICSSKKIKHVTTIIKTEFYQCQKCSHVFRKLHYKDSDLEKYWKIEGDILNVHSHTGQSKYRSKNLSDPKVSQVLKFCKIKNRKNLKWLDLGCGNGEFLSQVKNKGIDAYGFDLNKKDVDMALKKKLKVSRADLNSFYKFSVKNKLKFDVVSATGYFDMVNDPVKELKIVNSMLNKNGILMVDLPDFNSVTHELIRHFPNDSIRHLNAAQRSSFTLKSINYFLKKNGFRPLFRWHYGLDVYMIMNTLIQKNKNLEKTKTFEVLKKRFNDIQKIFDEEEKSDTLFFIAIKNN